MCASNARENTPNPLLPADAPLDKHAPRTPIDVSQLEYELRSHPNQAWCSGLIKSLRHGVRIGFQGQRTTRTNRNLHSAFHHPGVIDKELQKECARGRMAGPYQDPPLTNLQCAGVGVVPKKDGSWRMIMHLSAPQQGSINEGIDKETYSLRYSNIDDATRLIAAVGKGCYLAKVDLKSAFRLLPVAQQDWELLGIHWKQQYYVDKQLPFGLRSAPFLFNELADALHWILFHNYNVSHMIHYLDDFLIIAPSETECQQTKDIVIATLTKLGVPLSWDKVEGPSTCLTFLGIEIDTIAWKLRLPPDKLHDLNTQLLNRLRKKSCTKRQLLSLIGKMSFATKVLPAGRIFLRRLINLSTRTKVLHHRLHLNRDARADIHWWLTLLPQWNGSAPILEPEWTPSPNMHLYTDAAATYGFGAFFNNAWLHGRWLPHQQLNPSRGVSIAWQELYAIVIAARAWGHLWTGRRISAHCDNLAVVDIWGRRSSKCPKIMQLVRQLYFIAASHNFTIRFSHIQGINNGVADSLSRNDLARFRKLAPEADTTMTPLPRDA